MNMIVNKRIIVTHKSGGKIISKVLMQQDFGCARVVAEASTGEEVVTVPMPKSISVKPKVKSETSNAAPIKQAEPQPTIHTSPRMSKVGSGSGGHRQTFTWGNQTIPVH
jgi:hypothetical protein